jgi:hypothetical protein
MTIIGLLAGRSQMMETSARPRRPSHHYTEAIRLDPTFTRACYNGGFAKRAKGDFAGGDADIAVAKQRAISCVEEFAV